MNKYLTVIIIMWEIKLKKLWSVYYPKMTLLAPDRLFRLTRGTCAAHAACAPNF